MESSNKAIEIIADHLYWICDSKSPQSKKGAFYFSIDNELIYEPFSEDFGPLNLGHLDSFCKFLNKLMLDPSYQQSKIYHYCSENPKKKANAAYLICAFQVIYLKKTPAQAWKPFEKIKFLDFRDALKGECNYKCTIYHCILAIDLAIKYGWYIPSKFDVTEYQTMEKIEHGDMNWIVPGKFLAFSTPFDSEKTNNRYSHNPEFFIPLFKKMGIKHVIRLNSKEYDSSKFINAGINHTDLYFLDGSVPPDNILVLFLKITEERNYAFAVHCKAGLGRTGTLISSYVIKNYKMPATVMIAWNRICRPGSILGPQQNFLIDKEAYLMSLNSIFGNFGNKAEEYAELSKQIKVKITRIYQ